MKRLEDLVRGVACTIHGNPKLEIKGLAFHSSQVGPGYLFVAVEGFHVSGARFIDDAMNRGAVAVATTELANVRRPWVTIVTTPSPRRFLAQVANRFYDFPARKLALVGVTGTNGKTTTTFLLREMARTLGQEPGLVGTIEHSDGRQSAPAANTTPESLDLVRMLARMVENRSPVCFCEVSSHALELDRVFDLDFRVAAFTNLSQDHLDFHKSLRSYQEAKMKLFSGLPPTATVVTNLDDALGRDILARTRARVLTYGMRPDLEPVPDIWGRVLDSGRDGLAVELSVMGQRAEARLRLIGRYNLSNLLCALGVGSALGWPLERMVVGAEALECVPGRLERVRAAGQQDSQVARQPESLTARVPDSRTAGQPGSMPASGGAPAVFVDFAHTPDALRRMLETVREFTAGRVIVVFGAGGDRDQAKRPLMGRAVADAADVAVVTSDNPRSEQPQAIIAEIVRGMNGSDAKKDEVRSEKQGVGVQDSVAGAHSRRCRVIVEPDRRKAIRQALAEAQPGDTVVIAGKGHETYQLVGAERLPFDDRQVAAELLSEKDQEPGTRGQGRGTRPLDPIPHTPNPDPLNPSS